MEPTRSTRSFGAILEQLCRLCQELATEHNREISALIAKQKGVENGYSPVSVASIDLADASAAIPAGQLNSSERAEGLECEKEPPLPSVLESVVNAWHAAENTKPTVRYPAVGLARTDAKRDDEDPGRSENLNVKRPNHWTTLSLSIKKEKIFESLHDRSLEVKQFSLDVFKARDVWSTDETTLLRIKCKARTKDVQKQLHYVRQKTADGFAWDWFMIHPQSNARLVWDLVGMLWLAFDVIVLPIQVFPLPEIIFLVVMDYLGNFFWTTDIAASFFTGTYTKSVPVMEFKIVARRYIRSWFLFDIFIVTIGWGSIAMESMTSIGSLQMARAARTARFFRILRYLRLARLLRIVKSVQFFEVLQARANSDSSLFVLVLLKLTATVMFMSHILACCWYGVGDVPDGWVRTEVTHNGTGIQEWSVGDQYLYTYHWSLSRLHPSTIEKNLLLRTTNERIFAVFGGLCAMIVGAGFISMITNMMREFQEKHKRRKRHLTLVQAYVSKYTISPALAVRAKRYFDFEHEAKLRSQREAELMSLLPHEIVLDFRYEAFSPITSKNDFFAEIHRKHRRTHYDICHKLKNDTVLAGEVVFTTGDACDTMRFITTGHFCYTVGMETGGSDCERDEDDTRAVSVGAALSEAVLWTVWEHRGELYSKEGGSVLNVLAEDFAAVMCAHEQALVAAAIHARCFVDMLNATAVSELSDLPSSSDGGSGGNVPEIEEGNGILLRARASWRLKSQNALAGHGADPEHKRRRRSYPDEFQEDPDD